MKKRISKWLIDLALVLNPSVEVRDSYVAKKLGIGIHITKNDVKRFRKLNPEYTSHRKGLEALIEDTKKKAAMNIVAGIQENNIMEYDVRRTLWTADVKATLRVYVPKEKS